jgi:hypothetical protein
MNLGHADVILTPIIGERHLGIGHKAQGFGFIVAQSLQQVPGFATLGPSAPDGCFRGIGRWALQRACRQGSEK